MSLNDKVVVITGASAGIGAALAKQVGAAGGRPVLAARTKEALEQVAAECGPNALVVPADVTRRQDVERVLEEALERFDQVDVWVNNAGRGITRSVAQLTDDDFDEMMAVNVKSALYGMQVVLPHLQARGRGQIINVSSLLGRLPYVSIRSAYSAAKHALNALTVNLRMDLRERFPEIHISLVSPGPVATGFGNSALHGGPDSRKMPMAQSAEEVAAVILDVIVHPRADAYTRPEFLQRVAAYYATEDPAGIESQPPWMPAKD